MELKPRQQAAHDAVMKLLAAGTGKQLVNLPTGVGKTVLAAHVAKEFPSTLFLCHRVELVEQSCATLSAVSPERSLGFLKQGEHSIGQTTIGMVQSVHRRLGKLDPKQFDLVVIDEAHHACAKTWREVADHFQPKLRLGLSATPERSDGAALSNLFDCVAYSMTIREAVEENYLVPPRCLQITTSSSLASVRTMAGDYSESDLQRELNNLDRNSLIVKSYLEHAAERKAVVFCAGVAHAQDLAAVFQLVGVSADWVSGDDPLRSEKISRLADGRLKVLCNCQILTEGFDCPSLSAVLLARPTKSRSLYAQMLGRGLRLCEGKTDCLVLDYVDQSAKMSLVTAWRFFGNPGAPGGDEPVDPFMPERQKESRVRDAVDQAERLFGIKADFDVIARLVDVLKEPPIVDPFNFGASSWHYEAPTSKQIEMLRSSGFDVLGTDWTKGQASAVIGSLPASQGQIGLLLAAGFDVLTRDWTRQQASIAIDSAKSAELPLNWRRLRAA